MTPAIDTIIAEIAALASKCAGAGIAYMGSPASESFAKVCDELRAIQSNLAALPAPGEWIEIGLRTMPPEQRMVLFHVPGSNRGLIQWGYYGTDGHGNRDFWVPSITGGYARAEGGDSGRVTHWQPLPAAPLAAAQGEETNG